MIGVDASAIIPWLKQDSGADFLQELVAGGRAAVAPVTITELFSDKRGIDTVADAIKGFRVIDLTTGHWERAGAMRAALRTAGRKAPMADALIAQACIDANIPLLTRDADFKVYADLFGLKLA